MLRLLNYGSSYSPQKNGLPLIRLLARSPFEKWRISYAKMRKWFSPREYSFLSEISRQKIKIISAFPEISFYVHILRWFFPREIKRFICVTSILQEKPQRLGCKLYQGRSNCVHDEELIRNLLCGLLESVSHCWWVPLDSYTRKRDVPELHSLILNIQSFGTYSLSNAENI